MRKYTDDVASEECQKGIQAILDKINFPSTNEAALTIGCLIMQSVRCLDALMGPEYAANTILQVMDQMTSGKPQQNTRIEIINRSKLN